MMNRKIDMLINQSHNLRMKFPCLREGQSYIGTLAHIDNELYHKITATEDDPFYDDSKVSNFLNALNIYWYKEDFKS